MRRPALVALAIATAGACRASDCEPPPEPKKAEPSRTAGPAGPASPPPRVSPPP